VTNPSPAPPPALTRDAVLDVLQALVRTPSVNPVLAPSEGQGEAAVAAVARKWLATHGVRAWLEEVAPERPNLVAEVGTGGDSPTLVFCAHLDTVGTDGMTIPPFEPTVEGNRLYGRGSYDMKGGAAAAMCAAAALAVEDLPGRLLLALVADEEHGSLGTQGFLARHRADACIVTEPSEVRLILGHKGFVWARLTTRGRAAHGSRWDLGISAIGKMGRIITALERFDHEELRRRKHPLVGPASLHCALIEGGSGLSIYAESCDLDVERRILPGETAEQVLGELREVADSAGEEAEVELLLHRPPLVCPPDSAVATALREAATEITGEPPQEDGVGYWMDAALFADAGISTVDYGPAGQGAHEAVEWVDVDSVLSCARVLAETARRFLGS